MDENNTKTGAVSGEVKKSKMGSKLLALLLFVVVAAAAVFVVMPMYTAKQLGDTVVKTAGAVITGLQAAFKENVNYNEKISSVIKSPSLDKKYVVMTVPVDVEIARENSNRVFDDWIPTGNAVTKVKASNVRVQLYVPIEEIDIDDFSYDPKTETLSLNSPKIVIDKDMVGLDLNSIEVEENGSWVNTLSFGKLGPDVKQLTANAKGELCNEARRKVARDTIYMDRAREEAKKSLEGLFNILKESLKPGVKFQVNVPVNA